MCLLHSLQRYNFNLLFLSHTSHFAVCIRITVKALWITAVLSEVKGTRAPSFGIKGTRSIPFGVEGTRAILFEVIAMMETLCDARMGRPYSHLVYVQMQEHADLGTYLDGTTKIGRRERNG